jgi:hypothetical protein
MRRSKALEASSSGPATFEVDLTKESVRPSEHHIVGIPITLGIGVQGSILRVSILPPSSHQFAVICHVRVTLIDPETNRSSSEFTTIRHPHSYPVQFELANATSVLISIDQAGPSRARSRSPPSGIGDPRFSFRSLVDRAFHFFTKKRPGDFYPSSLPHDSDRFVTCDDMWEGRDDHDFCNFDGRYFNDTFSIRHRHFSGRPDIRRHPTSPYLPRRSHTSPSPPPPPPPPPNRQRFGIVGILNNNGCCYFNCVFQVLFYCLPFRQQVLSLEAPSGAPLDALKCLFHDLIESPIDCSGLEVIRSMGGHIGSRDAAVAFVAITDLFEKAELFQLTLQSRVEWPGGSQLYVDGPQPLVLVAARECQTLSDCLRVFSAPQSIENFLVDGEPTVVSVSREFNSVSQILMVQLSRFKNGTQPATQPIKPEEIMKILINGEILEFQLQAVITHYWGHYIAFVKKEEEWFEISDAVIEKVSIETVQGKGATNGLLFMYARMETVQPHVEEEEEGGN